MRLPKPSPLQHIVPARLLAVALFLSLSGCDSVTQGPIPDYSGWPTDAVDNVVTATLADDVSQLPAAPGSYEWYNFFAFDREQDIAISAIFLSANPWDTEYRKAVHAHRLDPEDNPAPIPHDHFLLQLNVTRNGKKVFTSIRNAPGTTSEFSTSEAKGRIGNSEFYATMENGKKVYHVSISTADDTNLNYLQAELTFHEGAPGFKVDDMGLYGGMPGGQLHQWQFPIGYPITSGEIKVTSSTGRIKLDHQLAGGGYMDHMWGEGMTADVLEAWHFGRVDLDQDGAAVYVWLQPRDTAYEAYGRLFRIHRDGPIEMHTLHDFTGTNAQTNAFGLDHFRSVHWLVGDNGSLAVTIDQAVEDWPFQVAGPASIDLTIPGDIDVTDGDGPGEYLWQPGIDHPTYYLLDGPLLDVVPYYDTDWNSVLTP